MDQITILAEVQMVLELIFDRAPFLAAGRPAYSQGIDWKECCFFFFSKVCV